MNLQALSDRTRSLSGIRLETLRSNDEIEAVINETYQEILSLYPWPFLRGEESVALAVGEDTLDLDGLETAFRYISSVVWSEPNRQTRLAQTTVDELDAVLDEEGEPRLYARVDDRNLRIWPSPNRAGTLTIRGQVELDALSSALDVPQFAEQFHPIIAYRAAARLLAEEGDDSGRSQSYQMDAAGYLQRMERHYMASGDIGLIRMGSQRKGR